MMKRESVLACACFAAVAACAAPSGAPAPELGQSHAPQCFRADQVYGYTSSPDGYVELQTASGPFQMRMGAGCPDFSWIMQIGVRPVYSNWLCAGHDEQIITAYQSQFSRCWVSDIQALTPGPLPA